MKRSVLPFALLLCLSWQCISAQGQNLRPATNYKLGIVIFKLLPEYREALIAEGGKPQTYRLADATLQNLCETQGSFSVKALYPQHWGRAAGKVDMSLIGELQFAETADVPTLCRRLMATGRFEYVEPRMIFRTAGSLPEHVGEPVPPTFPPFTPNDPMVGQQWHLGKIKAFDAWDVEQGDTSVLIAIVDTGVDYLHPDLAANIAVNQADPVNGVDDDGNGFVDDYLGWDFYYNDNNPMPGHNHGTAVAGVAAAVTNNGIGLAAPGFNSRIVIVKTSSDDPTDGNMLYGSEGIVYAADRGCRVINCSWGGPTSNSQYLSNVVRYATFDKNALVVSVAGNVNNNIPFYPASTEFVTSVAATNPSDAKELYSNFNYSVDISAPGSIWCTMPGGNYLGTWWGTSFSTAVVSGAAAILAAHDPSLTAVQLGERLRMTADNIDAQNPNYNEQLGWGRLNMYRALTESTSPAIRFSEALFTDGNDNIFVPGDTIRLSGTFVNYLAGAIGLVATLSITNSDVLLLDDSFSIGSLSTMSETNNFNEPFSFVVGANTPPDTKLPIRLRFQSVGYDDWQWLFVNINQTKIDINTGVISTTVNSEGRIGYASTWGDGVGLQYRLSGLTDGACGLMLGNDASHVSDAALNNWSATSIFANDFKIVEPIHEATHLVADIALTCAYNDSTTLPPTAVMGLFVRQNIYGWTGDHFIISEYEVTNNSANEYNTFHVGLWGETDVQPFTHNRAEQDSALHFGYVYNTTQPSPYIGIQLLGQSPYNLYVYEYSDTYGGVNVQDIFSHQEKYTTLNESRPSGGFGDADGEDVGLVVSSGPYQFAPGDTIKVAFAILAADSLEALRSAAEDAILRYEGLFVSAEKSRMEAVQPLKIYPNPAGDMVWVELPGMETARNLVVEVFDLSGKTIASSFPKSEGDALAVNTKHWPAGIYFLRLRSETGVRTGRFVKR